MVSRTELITPRLRLLPLPLRQLTLYLGQPEELEAELGFRTSRAVVTEQVQRAIAMKLVRMQAADDRLHLWLTYWLMVLRAAPYGAGLVGFKGFPDGRGEAEIGYGIDPGWQGHGLTTEAVRAMISWAFREPACRAVVARRTLRTNAASLRVLAKAGMRVYAESDDALWLRIDRSGAEEEIGNDR